MAAVGDAYLCAGDPPVLRDRSDYADVPEVELTIDMDGYGLDRDKLTKYDLYALQSASERSAMKLFFDWDVPLFTLARLRHFRNHSALVIYQ